MAATVYTGRNQNFTYTNSTGGNVRLIIYWLYVDQSAGSDRLTMRWGASGFSGNTYAQTGEWGGSTTFHMGKNCIFNNNSADLSSNSLRDNNSFAYPSEIYLANGHVFELISTNSGSAAPDRIMGYNIVVIPEDG
tara:strand:+ start:410 stop:814 length:405 start_codon:yes stop_codon:yes gene_type:complete